MKKLISLFVAVLMVVSMFTISASAAFVGGPNTGVDEDKYTGDSASTDVNIILDSKATTNKYAVDVTFTTATFTYTSSGSEWDPVNHKYVQGSGTWGDDEGSVTITNHSNLPITYAASASYEAETYGGLKIKFTSATVVEAAETIGATTIEACTVNPQPVPSATVNYKVYGTPNQSNVSSTKLGTVTITIAKVG